MKHYILVAACLAAFVSPFAANAATITAQNGFGTVASLSACKSVSKSAAFTTGTLVQGSDWQDTCVGFYSVDLDLAAKTLTLTGLEVGNYESAFLDISGIIGTTITGFSASGLANLFDPAAYGGQFATDVPTPTLSFTGNSLRLEWTSFGNLAPNDQFSFSSGGSSVFSFTTAGIPEPAAWAMMLAGFGLVGSAMRRRQKVAVSFA